MEEKTYTTDDILNELNISIFEFQLFLINRHIARNIGNKLVLFESYRDWMIEQEKNIFGQSKFIWTQLGHDHLVKLIGHRSNGDKLYSTQLLLRETGVSNYSFLRRLIDNGIINYSNGNITLRDEYGDWGRIETDEEVSMPSFKWTELGRSKILELFVKPKTITPTKKKVRSLQSSVESRTENNENQCVTSLSFTTDDIATELRISVPLLQKRLFHLKIVKFITGDIILNKQFQDWGSMRYDEKARKRDFFWTNKGRDGILERLANSNSDNSDENNTTAISEESLNSKERMFYTFDDLLKEVNVGYGNLRQYLINNDIVTYMRGKKITLSKTHKDWCVVFTDPSTDKKTYYWTETALNSLIKHFGKNKKKASEAIDNSPSIDTKETGITELIEQKTLEGKPTSSIIVTANSSELQKVFKTKYVDFLLEQAIQGQSLANYASEFFPIEHENILYIPSIKHPIGLLEKMNPSVEKDFESAIALYEAYPNLSPLQAADKTFWVYLAHTELFPYVQNRYPQVKQDGFNNPQYILDHWFFAQGPLRHSLAGLWWSVYLSMDNDVAGFQKYVYTKFIFSKDMNLRAIYFANSQLFRHKEAAIGILKFLMEDEEVCSTFFRQRFRYIIKYFNKLGGTRQLVSLDRNFFYHELKKIRSLIMAIQSDEDVKNSI